METKINRKVSAHTNTFKNDIKLWFENNNCDINGDSNMSDFLKYIFDYQSMVLSKEDLQKRKRIKNCVPQFNRCCARRANGEQCTRRKKETSDYCGTHSKGTPHGKIEYDTPAVTPLKKKEIWIQEIAGIHYFIDDEGKVYNHDEVIANKKNPEIIANYSFNDGIYSIPQFGISSQYSTKKYAETS